MQSITHPPILVFRLDLGDFPQTTQSRAHGSGGGSGDGVGTSSNSLPAALAVPDTGGVALDGGLSAEGAGVGSVLRDFHLLDLLTERGTISGTVLSGHADFL